MISRKGPKIEKKEKKKSLMKNKKLKKKTQTPKGSIRGKKSYIKPYILWDLWEVIKYHFTSILFWGG